MEAATLCGGGCNPTLCGQVGGQGRGEGFSVEHEEEKDGALVAWLAARSEPWLQLSLKEQTALEPSGPVAGAILSGMWARNIRARLGGQLASVGGAEATERRAPQPQPQP